MISANRDWKTYQRHPESAKYHNITGRAWTLFVENLRDNGNMTGRKVILLDGMVFDGWQLYRAHLEIGRKPAFEELPPGTDIKAYLSTVQDMRRHETQDSAMARVAERLKRVEKAISAGESVRVVAESESQSIAQTQRDIAKIESSVPGGTVAPADNIVVGKDGKKRKAKADPAKPKKPRGNKTHTPSKAAEDADVKDANDEQVCECARSAFVDADSFKKASDLLTQAGDIITKTIGSDAGHYLKGRTAHFETAINNLKSQWLAGRPDYNCPYCVDDKRTPKANCNCCNGCGWVPKHTYESSPRAKKEKHK